MAPHTVYCDLVLAPVIDTAQSPQQILQKELAQTILSPSALQHRLLNPGAPPTQPQPAPQPTANQSQGAAPEAQAQQQLPAAMAHSGTSGTLLMQGMAGQ